MGLYPEFEDRYAGRYFGKYRAFVVSTDDPDKLGRVSVKVPVVLGDEESGWALPAPSTGGRTNVGDFRCPKRGDYVWIEFEEGDPARPIWQAGPWALRVEGSQMPLHSKGAGDLTDYSYRDFGNVPPTQFEGTYGNVRYIGNDDGSFLEFDSTAGKERVQLSHKSASRLEFGSDGSLQIASIAAIKQRSNGEWNTEVGTNQILKVGGSQNIQIDGLCEQIYGSGLTQTFGRNFVSGPSTAYMSASLNQVGNSYTSVWDGSYQVTASGLLRLSADGNLAAFAGNKLSLCSTEKTEMVALSVTAGQSIGGSPVKSFYVQAYDGSFYASALDKTGLLSESVIEVSPGLTPIQSHTTLYAGIPLSPAGTLAAFSSPVGGCLQVKGDGSILLGGAAAIDFLIKGTTFNLALAPVLVNLIALCTALAAEVTIPATKTPATTLGTSLGVFTGQMATWLSLFSKTM